MKGKKTQIPSSTFMITTRKQIHVSTFMTTTFRGKKTDSCIQIHDYYMNGKNTDSCIHIYDYYMKTNENRFLHPHSLLIHEGERTQIPVSIFMTTTWGEKRKQIPVSTFMTSVHDGKRTNKENDLMNIKDSCKTNLTLIHYHHYYFGVSEWQK